jgi:hypothetical protein
VVLAVELDGLPEGGEDFLVIADEDVVGAHGGHEALGAKVEGVVELDEAVLVFTGLDHGEDLFEGETEKMDFMDGLHGRHLLEVLALGGV